MRRHTSPRWLWLGLVTLLLGIGAGGLIAYFAYSRSIAGTIRAGETAYQAGRVAFFEGKDAAAQVKFHEAMLLAEMALRSLEKERERQEVGTETGQRLQRQEGEAFWLKARAIHARSFAKMRSEGKPLPIIEGLPDDKKVLLDNLPWLRIPEEAARGDAVACLRQAALRLRDDEVVQRSAVALEAQMDPPQWGFVQTFAHALLQLDSRDDRARYLVARFEFEQPRVNSADPGTPAVPVPPAKRSRDRMLRAREHLKALAAVENPPRWRTLHLDAQVSQWLIAHYQQPTQRKPEAEEAERRYLRTLLFDENTGAMTRAPREEQFNRLSRLDVEGMLALHQIALDYVVDEQRRGHQAASAPLTVGNLLEATVALTIRLLGPAPSPARLAECAERVVYAAGRAQPYLAKEKPEAWKPVLEKAQDLTKQAAERKAGSVALFLRLADVLGQEAELAHKRGQAAEATERRKQAVGWIDQGLAVAAARKTPPEQALPLHEAAARLKALGGGRRDELSRHLQALKESKNPVAQASAFLIEGALAEREGRLEKARTALEKCVQLAGAGDLGRRAHTVLAHLYLALNQPEKALASLQEVQRAYARWEQLADEEKAWVFEFVKSPQDLTALTAVAHLQAAGQAYRQALAARPTAEVESIRAYIANHERSAAELVQSIPARSPQQLSVRRHWVEHLAATDRWAQAETEVAALRRDYPESLAALRLEVGVLTSTKTVEPPRPGAAPVDPRTARLAKADARIQQFMGENVADFAARLFWVEWLLTTGRGAQAIAYLDNPQHFPGGAADPRYQRLRSLALLARGEADRSREILQAATPDPVVDATLIQAAATLDEKEKRITAALGRYDDAGLFRCFGAHVALARKDYVEAAKGFLQAIETTRVRPVARQGIQSTLLNLAQEHPRKARDLATQLLQDYPGEPALLAGYAYACLLLGELGTPSDPTTQVKDMATALNAFEAAVIQENRDTVTGPMVKARLWMLANRPDRARPEVQRALGQNPRHVGALVLSLQLALASDDPVAYAAAGKTLAALKAEQPTSIVPELLAAQIAVRESRFADAIKVAEDVARLQPQSAAPYPVWIEALEKSGPAAEPEVLAKLREWRQKAPLDLDAATAAVRYAAKQGQRDEARQILDQFLAQLDSLSAKTPPAPEGSSSVNSRPMATVALARGLVQAGAFTEAEAWLQRVLDTDPTNEAAWILLGENQLAQLLASTDRNQRLHFATKARDAFAKVYQQSKGHLVAGNNLAWLLAGELNEPEEAYRILDEVRRNRFTQAPMPVEQLPIEVIDTLGVTYRAMRKPALAAEQRDVFEAARRRYPQDARVYLYLGDAYAALKDARKAEQMYASAIALASAPAARLSEAQKQRIVEAAQRGQQQLTAR